MVVLGPGGEDTGVAIEKRWNHESRTVNSRVNPFDGLAISPALGLGADRAKAISKTTVVLADPWNRTPTPGSVL